MVSHSILIHLPIYQINSKQKETPKVGLENPTLEGLSAFNLNPTDFIKLLFYNSFSELPLVKTSLKLS